MILPVLGAEVLDERFPAVPCLLADLRQKPVALVGRQGRQRGRVIRVGEGIPAVMCVVVGQLGADGDLDAFDSVHDQETQLAVERVAVPYHIECGAWPEGLAGKITERIPVPTQAVVVHRLEVFNDQPAIAGHASLDKKVGLLFQGESGFGVDHGCAFRPTKKPAEVSVPCGRGPTGMLQEGIARFRCSRKRREGRSGRAQDPKHGGDSRMPLIPFTTGGETEVA